MEIAIMGCGPSGSYLYRLLKQRRPEVKADLFNIKPDTKCGVKSCGWGVNFSIFANLCYEAGLDPNRYVLTLYHKAVVEDMPIKANLAVINKPLFIEHMISGTKIQAPPPVREYDRIIDATSSRAYLGCACETFHYDAVETRVRLRRPIPPTGFINTNGGYSWVIPLGDSTAHLGSLSTWGRQEVEREIEKTKRRIDVGSTICECSASIWCAGLATPFTKGNVWGLGESIGLVDPVTGVGITLAMDSARMMIENWDDPVNYEREILSRYSYMMRQARIMQKLVHRQKPNILDTFLLHRASHLTGMYPSVMDVIRLVRAVVKSRGEA